jgi:hypothetical protein
MIRRSTTFVAVAALGILAACASNRRNTPVVMAPGEHPSTVAYGGETMSLPAGTVLWVKLDSTISARQNAPGDTFVAHIPEDIRSSNGETLIPQGAVVTGRVTDMRQAMGNEPMAVRLEVTSIEMGGASQPLHGDIVEADVSGKGGRVRATDVAIGAGAGALIGAILDGGKGALIGGAIGAGAGTLVSLGRQGEMNELPRGTNLAIELRSPVTTLAGLRYGGRYY